MNAEERDKAILASEVTGQVAPEEQEVKQVDTALAEEALQVSEQAAVEEKPAEQAVETPAAEVAETPAAESEQKPAQSQAPEVSGAFAQMKRDQATKDTAHATEVATLQSQIAAQNIAKQQVAAPVVPVEDSPRVKYLKENPEAEYFPPAVEIEEERFISARNAKIADGERQKSEFDTVTVSLRQAGIDITDETHGVSLSTLISVGGNLLTPKDQKMIYDSGGEAGAQMHHLLTMRIKNAGITIPKAVVAKPTGAPVVPDVPKPENPIIVESEVPELLPQVAEICSEIGIDTS